ncbi:methylamine utilization protein [Pseudoalteromonas sp. A25]|uniref:methylamine utilization protein n=1 Tax=Pseudoalteromonas sp. A25 TaxID=116092 RepID=UPI00126127C7|nr:methylamine utilization protein [Pseudoalteromonas sp. A25]BBN82902.1 methylamine utilization protein [Pseudoalteromonas sp. A25]
MPRNNLNKYIVSALGLSILSCLSSAIQAKTLTLVDQFDEPVENAVVELLGAAASKPHKSVMNTPAIMDQVQKQFEPKLLTIVQGQQVSFPNSDDIRHHVYSFSPAKPFELKLYAGTPKAPIVFEQPGVVVLGCNIHDSMVGYIYVANSPAHFVSDKRGKVTLPDSTRSYFVWHPQQKEEITERVKHNWPVDMSEAKVEIELTAPLPRNTFGEMFKEHHGN